MREIHGDAKNIRSLLSGAKYAIDYYQRDYRWEQKQVTDLLNDLSEKFFESYDESHERAAVGEYRHYFLGSIIISNKDGKRFIVDGQQRLTTLTLLLVYLHHQLEDSEDKYLLSTMIFSKKQGRRSFNLESDERTCCMEALYKGEPFDENDQPESVQNIVARYGDIEDDFPEELREKPLSHFVDWLIDSVYLVEITAYSDQDAYSIFETMNDRGLSLTPTDMLKGYLLAEITDVKLRDAASRAWKSCLSKLREFGKDAGAEAIKAWLRSQHVESIRERKPKASPRDFDLVGTEFHRWVRNSDEKLGLTNSSAFAKFIEQDFAFYSRMYRDIRRATNKLTAGLECIYYNAQKKFTLQYPLLLAPLTVQDGEAEIRRKLGVVAAFLDILLARRIWNRRATSYSTMSYAMFLVTKEIRRKSAFEVADLLAKRLEDDKEIFSQNPRFSLHGQNRRMIKRMLARLTDHVEVRSGGVSRYEEYVTTRGKKAYEIEHIWANHADQHEDEFGHPTDFQDYRNRIGGLLLLPKSFNASYGDMPYKEKRPHYNGQNLLARSLCDECYERNPGFKRYLAESGQALRAHTEFKKNDLDARQKLYLSLAEEIWNPDKLHEIATA